jgi:hypothetical protein
VDVVTFQKGLALDVDLDEGIALTDDDIEDLGTDLLKAGVHHFGLRHRRGWLRGAPVGFLRKGLV